MSPLGIAKPRPRLVDLGAGQRKWPCGEDGCKEQTFCAEPVAIEGAPYCHAHMKQAYRPTTKFTPRMIDREAKQSANHWAYIQDLPEAA